jgi:hypothetical protein
MIQLPFELSRDWCSNAAVAAELKRRHDALPPNHRCHANAADEMFEESFRSGLTFFCQKSFVAEMVAAAYQAGFVDGLRRQYFPATIADSNPDPVNSRIGATPDGEAAGKTNFPVPVPAEPCSSGSSQSFPQSGEARDGTTSALRGNLAAGN